MASSMKEAAENSGLNSVPYWTEKNLPKKAYEFPRKPLLDRIIVREIPIAEYYEQPEGVTIDLNNSNIKERSDRGEVVAVSRQVEKDGEVGVGDTVFFDEFCMCDPVYLNSAHKNRSDLPKYWQIRLADLKGVQCE